MLSQEWWEKVGLSVVRFLKKRYKWTGGVPLLGQAEEEGE